MPDNILMLSVSWGILTLVVIGLALYKKSLDSHIDESIHVNPSEDGVIRQQVNENHRSEVVEKWGKSLTVVVMLYGLYIIGVIAYHQWTVASTAGFR